MLTALSEKNIKVPDDMSMIVFNNSVISKVSNPPLTTVDTQIYQLGYESANCLIELVKDPKCLEKVSSFRPLLWKEIRVYLC